MQFLIVFLGGGIGSATRHGVNILAARLIGTSYPIGTLVINVLGSLLMGMVVEFFALRGGLSPQLRLFLTTGIIGGFTTFSTFSLETAMLNSRNEAGAALIYVLASVVLGVGALYLGMTAVRAMLDN